MTAHYQEFRLYDPAVIARIVARWPFAAIVANGPEWPVVAHAPLTLTLRGRLAVLSDAELAAHLADLVGQTEGEAGWRIAEIDPGFFACDAVSRSELVVPFVRDGVILAALYVAASDL